ncbi:phosphatidylinositol glycan, class U [Fistulifera solaris]|uniref:Phosphatidylinositol glycan, class U n=1 Tax=Fistulifera solaris TaxID=1519565 RepID=A0A1Z5K124_FISSO|nr:phosphatidylinositol glycan, class U [Fistulifera solaris]|eukprot:GAX19859.1 phosphatidylinositol glycan, class U [Fistulifera solaris]
MFGETTAQMSERSEQTSFLRSPSTSCATVLRCLCVFGLLLPSEWLPWIYSRAVQSTLIDDIFTLGHVLEALAIRQLVPPHSFASTYEGHTIHLPPLLLALFQPVSRLSESQQHTTVGLCLIVVDLLIAWTLERLGKFVVQQRKTEWEDKLQEQVPEAIQPKLSHIFEVTKESNAVVNSATIPLLMAQLYYWSPITLLTSNVFVCYQNIPVLFSLIGLINASQGSLIWGALSLVLASYINVHHALFVVPSVILIRERRKSVVVFLISFLSLASAMQALSLYLVGTSEFLLIAYASHIWTFQFQGIEPSLSTLWYFGMEMFDRFSMYFTVLMGGAPYLLVIPLWIRLYRYPEAMIALFWLLGTVFRPPATLYSLNVAFCLLLLSSKSLARLRVIPSLIAVSSFSIPVALYVVNTWLWLDTGSGEANFMFFQCLVYNAFVAIIFVQFVAACLRRDKALRLTEKLSYMGDVPEKSKQN